MKSAAAQAGVAGQVAAPAQDTVQIAAGITR